MSKDAGHRHDVDSSQQSTSMSQATLSIGPHLLLKVQFQHHFYSLDLLSINPKSWSLATPPCL